MKYNPRIQLISNKYGIIKLDSILNTEKTFEFIEIIKPQIKAQSICELLHSNSSPIFHYGLRWGRLWPENTNIKPLENNKILEIDSYEKGKYAYTMNDQFDQPLANISLLKPIIQHIEESIGIDMSHYDSMIGNIYLDGMYIPPHCDTTESKTAQNYPVIVFTIGNDSALGIWNDDIQTQIKYKYDSYPQVDCLRPNNEIQTQNGTIYAFGLMGKGRFNCIHATPVNNHRLKEYPVIELPANNMVRSELRGLKSKRYTITLTFRRSQDIDNNIPVRPSIIGKLP